MKPGDPNQVEAMFDRVASTYDLLNDLFSITLHRIWKRKFVATLKPMRGEKWIDLCCGTGDIAILLSDYVGDYGEILAVDYADMPLRIARQKIIRKSFNNITCLKKDVLQNGFPKGNFDGVVIAYGLRNLSDPKEGLREIRRLLKPGGKAGILDFRSFDSDLFGARFQKFYLRKFVVPIATIFGLGKEYAYLEKSLKCFPSGINQKKMALDLGFKNACFKSIAFGQMGILLLEN